MLQIGDASGIQSPLSFGGFGALTRHLARLTAALTDALSTDALSARDLGLINSYNPGLRSAWMLQVGGEGGVGGCRGGGCCAGGVVWLGGGQGCFQTVSSAQKEFGVFPRHAAHEQST